MDTEDSGPGKGKQPVTFGVGMVKGREDEWGEPADVQTKVSRRTLYNVTSKWTMLFIPSDRKTLCAYVVNSPPDRLQRAAG